MYQQFLKPKTVAQAWTAETLLARMGAELAGRPGTDLEFSLRLQAGQVRTTGRFGCWLQGQEPADFAPITQLLEHLDAPQLVQAAQHAAEMPFRQGLGVAFTADGPEFRLYLHGRTSATLADHYHAWRWSPGHAARHSSYTFHFLPETPAGHRPLDFVSTSLQPAFAQLLAEAPLQQLSGFWLREDDAGAVEQLDLALPWHPQANTLSGVAKLVDVFNLPAATLEHWQTLPIRHIACSVGATQPTVTLYASASVQGTWPRTEAELQAHVYAGSAVLQQVVAEQLSAVVSPAVANHGSGAGHSTLGRFYDGEASLWERVLGPELHYHAGLFQPNELLPDDDAMQAALRRAVTDLYPFIPEGGRLYDIGCGWGGPLAMWIRDLRCRSLGVTISQAQYRHVAAQGLPVRWANAEQTLPPGSFDCAVLLESFSHIQDKARLLRRLRPFVGRLVMRVNCQESAKGSTAFGGTMHMISSGELRGLLEDAGWRVGHWQDRRSEAWPTISVWHRRLLSVPSTQDVHFETFRAWCARVVQDPQAWSRHNPLIELAAD